MFPPVSFHLFVLTAVILALTHGSARADEPSPEVTPEIVVNTWDVHATKPRPFHPERTAPGEIALSPSPAHLSAGQVAGDLGELSIREYGGPGSIALASSRLGLNASETRVRLNGIMLTDPTGSGIDLSLFPANLLDQIAFSTFAAGCFVSGGVLDLRLQPPKPASGRPWHFQTVAGSGLTMQNSLDYGTPVPALKGDVLVAASNTSTQGRYHYNDPRTGVPATRQDNDQRVTSVLTSYSSTSVDVFQLVSMSARGNPGTLDFPVHQRQDNTLALAGGRWTDTDAIAPGSGAFASVSGQYSLLSMSDPGANQLRQWTRSRGLTGNAGLSRKMSESATTSISVDEEFSDLTFTGTEHSRNLLATNFSSRWTFLQSPAENIGSAGSWTLNGAPAIRLHHADSFNPLLDATLRMTYAKKRSPENWDATLAYGFLHAYPALPSLYGYSADGFSMQANPGLGVEHSHLLLAEWALRSNSLTARVDTFARMSLDRAVFSSVSPTEGKMESVSRAIIRALEGNVEAPLFRWGGQSPIRIGGRLEGMWTSGRNLDSGGELPYQPALQGSSALEARWKLMSFEVEERLFGECFSDLTNTRRLPRRAETNANVTVPLWRGIAALRVLNIFDASGWVTDGVPAIGRSVWVGYRL